MLGKMISIFKPKPPPSKEAVWTDWYRMGYNREPFGFHYDAGLHNWAKKAYEAGYSERIDRTFMRDADLISLHATNHNIPDAETLARAMSIGNHWVRLNLYRLDSSISGYVCHAMSYEKAYSIFRTYYEWCRENIAEEWFFRESALIFTKQEDRVLFAIRFGF